MGSANFIAQVVVLAVVPLVYLVAGGLYFRRRRLPNLKPRLPLLTLLSVLGLLLKALLIYSYSLFRFSSGRAYFTEGSPAGCILNNLLFSLL